MSEPTQATTPQQGKATTPLVTDEEERKPCVVAVFTGPREGVGKSQVCLNLALAWANHREKPVLIVTLDPHCRNEHAYFLGLNSPTVFELSQWMQGSDGQTTGAVAKLLKGKIPLSQWGVGTLALGRRRKEAQQVRPDTLLALLSGLSETYDIFLDVDPFFPMQVMAFDLADVVFWTVLPHLSHLQATANTFQEIKELHYPVDRFELVVNEFDLPGAVAQGELERFASSLGRRILGYLPWEDFLLENQNKQKIVMVEKRLQSDWVKGLKPLLGRLAEIEPEEKDWAVSLPPGELGWGARAPAGGSAGGATAAPGAKKDEPRNEWNALKERIHHKAVAAMETERITIGDNAAKDPETRGKVEGILEDILGKDPEVHLGREQRTKFVTELLDEILGLGPLEEILRNEGISEIMVNGPDHVYVERSGKLTLTDWKFRDEEQLVQVIKRIVAPLNRRIDESVPLVDCRLKDGSRVNAIIPPLAVSGSTLTIRRFSAKPLVAGDLIKRGSVTQNAITYLEAAVIIAKNIIVSGGTGTGKTTFLNMLSNYIPDGDRIITVEDTAELRLMKEHWVRLESRPANIEGKGEVSIRELVKNCLRMRPDRIVVGECRGGEALDMLQAMNTGHDGSLTTIHANAPKEAVGRLEAMCLMAGSALPSHALRDMISSAVHMFVQLSRLPDGSRKVTYVSEVLGRDEKTGDIVIKDIFRFKQTGVDNDGHVLGEFKGQGYIPSFHGDFANNGLDIPLDVYEVTEEAKKEYEAKAGPRMKVKRGH